MEQEICDIDHYIEFFNLDAAKGYKAYKMLQNRRIERHKIKDEMFRVTVMLESDSNSFANNETVKKIGGLENRFYQPRVLKELFEV